MQDSLIVRGFDTGTDLPEQTMSALHRNGALPAQQLIERFAFDVFHHQKEHAFIALAEISHVDNVRVLDRCGSARFALEPRDGLAFLQVFV